MLTQQEHTILFFSPPTGQLLSKILLQLVANDAPLSFSLTT